MRFCLLLFLFIAIAGTSQAGTGNDRIATSRADYLKNKIAGGDGHTIEIRNGQLWAWGRNDNGQLGDGTTTNKNTPVQIGTADNWICVTAGAYHSLGIQADGSLWGWGSNNSGQLGDGTTTFRSAPVRIGIDNTWAAVVANGSHTLAVKADGTLWAWGNNGNGQLGDGTNTNRNAPVQIGTARDWVTIAPGDAHSLAIKANGTLWAWGNNTAGQLGDGSKTNRNTPVQVGTANNWINVATGAQHTIALQANGTLWAWGENNDGQLGDSTYNDTSKPVQIDTARNWAYISVGAYHSLALKANGTVWAWGNNNDGQLGDSTNTKRNIPVHIDTANRWKSIYACTMHSLGIKADGAVMAWGDNRYGQLGNGANIDKNYAIQFNTADEWLHIKSHRFHNLGIKADGSLWAWGSNGYGQLGDSTKIPKYTPVQIGSQGEWLSFACGSEHSVGIKVDGTLWAWGSNYMGQLGDSTFTDKISPVQIGSDSNWIAISGGEEHTHGLKSDGTLWSWGINDYGQLGDGSSSTLATNFPVRVDTSTNWVYIIAGGWHGMGIKADGTLWGWGDGQAMGNGTFIHNTVPVQITTSNNWAHVTGGEGYTLAIKTDGTLWAWGYNYFGQLGDSSNVTKASPVQIGTANDWVMVTAAGVHTLGVKSDGTLLTWGYNFHGQLGDATLIDKNTPIKIGSTNDWVGIAASYYHSLGLKSDRNRICATGEAGKLGDGSTQNRTVFQCYCIPIKVLNIFNEQNVCPGNNTHFRIEAKYATRYQWQGNDGNGWSNLNNDTTYSYINTNKLILSNIDTSYKKNWYRCIAYNSCGDSTISDSAQIAFNLSVISTHPQDSSVCANTKAGFTVVAAGGPFTYQWQVNDGSGWSNVANTGMYSGADKDTLLLKAAPTTANGYKYRCIVGGICPPGDTSDEAVLTITTKYNAPAVIAQPASVRIMENSDTTFTVASADPDLSYQWQVNDGINWTDISNAGVYSDATTDTLNLAGVPYTMNGYQFRCLLILPCAPITISSVATLTVDTIPAGIATTNTAFKALNLHPNPNNGTFIIEGELATVSADEVNITILNGLGQIVYRTSVQPRAGKLNHTIITGKDLAPGSYMLKLDYGGEQDYKRFVIMK